MEYSEFTINCKTYYVEVEEYTKGTYDRNADNDIEYYGELNYYFVDEEGNQIDTPAELSNKDIYQGEKQIKADLDYQRRYSFV
jgi:hypothetical protein